MPVIISMLRGVNVGGHNKVKMDSLRTLYESLDLRGPRTYVQSGNVVFATKERDLLRLSRRISEAIERKFSFRVDVILRTSHEVRSIITRNPFASRRGIEPSKLLITFLVAAPTREAREKLLAFQIAPEELRIDGRELYIYYLNGIGRAKLSWPVIERTLRISGTGRNWNSITKLLEIAESLEASE